jgi:DNA-directed RNA polymerase specialized sigma24 family protein
MTRRSRLSCARDQALDALLTLPERQQQAVLLLEEGTRIGEVAKLLRVNRKTVYRWTIEPTFAEIRRAIFDSL